MINNKRILGLFFSDRNNLIYDKIKFSENMSLSEKSKAKLKTLSFKFLGPVFLTAACCYDDTWKIELIESSLSHYQKNLPDVDMIQSFFSLNSSIENEKGTTNLFTLIGSDYTEDIKEIYDILSDYIHPSIIQGEIVNEDLLGNRFIFHKFVQDELMRGIHLINYSLGNSRKVYWEEQHGYTCVGLIERIVMNENKESYLYTFYKDNPLRKKALAYIPSFYVMSILPDYYESLINETLKIFNKKSVFPNIRLITLTTNSKKAIYLQEYLIENDIKKNYGVILIQDEDSLGNLRNLSFYKKNLRSILDNNKDLNEMLQVFNQDFAYQKWSIDSEDDLNNIRSILDNIFL
jgi:hypothetical protein